METREIETRPHHQKGVFATRSYAVGEVICQEAAPLFRLSPVDAAQEASLVSALSWDKSKPEAAAAVAKQPENTTNTPTTLWQRIQVPCTIPEPYHGTFKGMVQAALCWTVVYNDNDAQADKKQTFRQLYFPNLDKPTQEEATIVDVARQALQYLKEHGIVTTDTEILACMLIWACNAFEQGRVYQHMSRINHSCNPNAVVQPIDDETGRPEGQRVLAAAPIAVGDEICISYLGMLLYAERSVRLAHLQQTKHFVCACSRCGSNHDDDLAACIPCFTCHPRVGRQLDEDTQYDDELAVRYAVPRPAAENNRHTVYRCTACQSNMLATDSPYAKYVAAGQTVVDKTVVFLRDYQSRKDDDNNDDDEEEDVQEELIDQHIRMASSVLGAKHWTTNLLLLLQVDTNLQTLHGAMLMAGDPKSSSPDLDSIAATVDSLERVVRFVQGLGLKLHLGHLVGDVIIGLARALVALGDEKSQKYAVEWLEKIADDYVQPSGSSGLQKVVQSLQTAWQRTDEASSKPPAKKVKR